MPSAGTGHSCDAEARQTNDTPSSSAEQLAQELAALQQLQEISTRLVHGGDIDALYRQIVDAAVAIMRSDMASMQLLHSEEGRLQLLAHHGFHPASAEAFRWVRTDTGCTCGEALRTGERVIAEDVETCEFIAGTAGLEAYRQSGIRAVQTTPLVARDGQLLGMVSTHWRSPHQPAARDLCIFDILARQAADLIERAKAAAELRASERRFREMIDALPAAIYTTDADGRVSHFNPAAEKLSGRKPELGTDKWCVSWKLYRPDGTPLPHDKCPMAIALQQGRVVSGEEIVAERPDGSRAWIVPYPTPMHDAAGQLVGGINMLVDITERKQAEESRAKLAAIVESSDDAIISKTLGGVITSWNQAAERLFGYSADEAIGKHIHLIIPVERYSEEDEVLARLRRGEKINHFETERQAKDGRRMNIALTVSPLRASDGRIIGASKVARDITDRKLAEQALQEADRRKNEFLATLAHELRNPLAPIRNSLHLLRMQESTPAAERVHDMLERQVGHLVRLVDDLLEISRITSGKIELRTELVEIAAVVRTALEISRPLIDASGHQLAITLPSEPITVDADPMRLSQIIANLLNNAAKYTDPGGQIWLTADRHSGEAVVSVRDTGIGLAADVLPRVFDMFTQVDRDHKRAQGGLGIGLALVRRLAELHGGRVEAKSDGIGKGSEFTIHLPLATPRDSVAPTKSLTPDGQRVSVRRRVLIVDDNRDAAASLALLLKLLGTDAQTANDGPTALEAVETYRPDLVLLDLGMPGMSGFEVARRLREHRELGEIMLVALTGWGQEEDRRRTQAAGFDSHLVKPVDLAALSSLIGGLTAARSAPAFEAAGLQPQRGDQE